jgi:hypothetical protein
LSAVLTVMAVPAAVAVRTEAGAEATVVADEAVVVAADEEAVLQRRWWLLRQRRGEEGAGKEREVAATARRRVVEMVVRGADTHNLLFLPVETKRPILHHCLDYLLL